MPYAKIATHQATFTLQQLHAELAGKILDNKAEGERLAEAMKHVEAVIKLLDPSYNVARIAVRRRKPNQWFKRGTIFRAVLEVLRDAEAPISTDEIATVLLRSKGVQEPTREQRLEIEGAIASSLAGNNGKSVRYEGDRPRRWQLLRPEDDSLPDV
jgi:hypothetical protein